MTRKSNNHSIVQKITPQQRERIILMYLKGYSKNEIVNLTEIGWWHVNAAIYAFDEATADQSDYKRNLQKIRTAEERLIDMAKNDKDNSKYKSLLYAFSTANINSRLVFLP